MTNGLRRILAPVVSIFLVFGPTAARAADPLVFLRLFLDHHFIAFLQTPIAQEVWMAQSGFLTPYKGVNTAAYANDALRKEGEILLVEIRQNLDDPIVEPGFGDLGPLT